MKLKKKKIIINLSFNRFIFYVMTSTYEDLVNEIFRNDNFLSQILLFRSNISVFTF